MSSDADKRIRSLKENAAGKVVTDPDGNRWQWASDDDTELLLKRLSNDELEIEQTDIRPNPAAARRATAAGPAGTAKATTKSREPRGFDPYDNPGKSRRR